MGYGYKLWQVIWLTIADLGCIVLSLFGGYASIQKFLIWAEKWTTDNPTADLLWAYIMYIVPLLILALMAVVTLENASGISWMISDYICTKEEEKGGRQ